MGWSKNLVLFSYCFRTVLGFLDSVHSPSIQFERLSPIDARNRGTLRKEALLRARDLVRALFFRFIFHFALLREALV